MLDTIFLILLVAVLVYEAVAMFNKRRRDTISEKSWMARDYALWSRALVDTLIIWTFWHLVIDDTLFNRGPSWVDLFVVAAAIYWAYWSWGHDQEKA